MVNGLYRRAVYFAAMSGEGVEEKFAEESTSALTSPASLDIFEDVNKRAREEKAVREEFSRIQELCASVNRHDFSHMQRRDLLYVIAKSRNRVVGVDEYDDETLRGIAETLFEGLPTPNLYPTFKSIDDFIRFDSGIRRVQRWVRLNIEHGWVSVDSLFGTKL